MGADHDKGRAIILIFSVFFPLSFASAFSIFLSHCTTRGARQHSWRFRNDYQPFKS